MQQNKFLYQKSLKFLLPHTEYIIFICDIIIIILRNDIIKMIKSQREMERE